MAAQGAVEIVHLPLCRPLELETFSVTEELWREEPNEPLRPIDYYQPLSPDPCHSELPFGCALQKKVACLVVWSHDACFLAEGSLPFPRRERIRGKVAQRSKQCGPTSESTRLLLHCGIHLANLPLSLELAVGACSLGGLSVWVDRFQKSPKIQPGSGKKETVPKGLRSPADCVNVQTCFGLYGGSGPETDPISLGEEKVSQVQVFLQHCNGENHKVEFSLPPAQLLKIQKTSWRLGLGNPPDLRMENGILVDSKRGLKMLSKLI
ncbi:uncharacterized protein LOC133376439 [Rhineura floridana]|uniref:uncharacterized protein LOC133376439 n=1 Tax=Rhineura floridana TaxID=261503 RepID=UPI002AC85889|nr:uncharacterized protein LOC133376439 [Rhineura floridana]